MRLALLNERDLLRVPLAGREQGDVRVLRRLWSSKIGTSGTGGPPERANTRWPSALNTNSPPVSGSLRAARSGGHHESAKS